LVLFRFSGIDVSTSAGRGGEISVSVCVCRASEAKGRPITLNDMVPNKKFTFSGVSAPLPVRWVNSLARTMKPAFDRLAALKSEHLLEAAGNGYLSGPITSGTWTRY
jgi:hypothetical protein